MPHQHQSQPHQQPQQQPQKQEHQQQQLQQQYFYLRLSSTTTAIKTKVTAVKKTRNT